MKQTYLNQNEKIKGKNMNLESEQKDQLYTALSQAQHEFPTIRVNRKAFKNEYADLYAMLKPILSILNKYGLSVHEWSGYIESIHCHGVRLAHKSGQYTTNAFPFVYDDPKPSDQKTHKIAGAQTYFFRYYVKGILGLVISDDPEDDDGQGPNITSSANYSSSEYLSKEQLQDIEKSLDNYPEIEESILKRYGHLYKIPKDKYLSIMDGIRMRKNEYDKLK